MATASGSDAAQAFHERARLAEERLGEVLAAYRALKTENEGYRDRITRNLEHRFDQRRERLLLRFIEILDNLDRALEAAELTYAGNPLIEGLILVRSQLLQALQEEGLERIPVVGLPYDPAVSEAVLTQPVEDPDEHHLVLRDLVRGYRLNGRVVRASKAVVAEYAAAAATKEVEPSPTDPPEPAVPEKREDSGTHEVELTLSGLRLEDLQQLALQRGLVLDDAALPPGHEALFPTAYAPEARKEGEPEDGPKDD